MPLNAPLLLGALRACESTGAQTPSGGLPSGLESPRFADRAMKAVDQEAAEWP